LFCMCVCTLREILPGRGLVFHYIAHSLGCPTPKFKFNKYFIEMT